jgi:glycosyltransferase involved in cell wall biosynthesis
MAPSSPPGHVSEKPEHAPHPRHRPPQLRVAMLLSSPPGPPSGGPGNYVIGLCDALRRNNDLDVVLLAPDTIRGASGRRVAQILLALEQLVRLLSVRPDVAHVHDHPALLFAAVAYRQLAGESIRVIYTSHFDLVDPRALWKRMIVGAIARGRSSTDGVL